MLELMEQMIEWMKKWEERLASIDKELKKLNKRKK